MCKNAVKKLPFVIQYVSDHYKTKNDHIENGGMLGFIPDCYKDQKMFNNAVDNYFHALRLANDCYKSRKYLLLILILLQYNLFLNVISLKKCVIKLLIFVLLYLVLFLIDI